MQRWRPNINEIMAAWWNGRHKGLKIPRQKCYAGSSPAAATKEVTMAIAEVKRRFTYSFSILEVETTEGGCNERTLKSGMQTVIEAIMANESMVPDTNCTNYIVVDYQETT